MASTPATPDRPRQGWRAVLFARRSLGIQLGTERLEAVLAVLAPGLVERPPFVVTQIVGTNGKGSTAAMLAHGLGNRVQGPVGLYTSPHLHRVGERVRVDGVPVSDEVIRVGVERVARAEQRAGVSLSFFEVLTALALAHFVARGCTHVVLEAGLGGRYDATSVLPSALTLIAKIGLDHQAVLGESIEAIAAEKGAVLHAGAPAISVAQIPTAWTVLRAQAARVGATLRVVAPLAAEGPDQRQGPRQLPLLGAHQGHNAALALAGLSELTGEPASAELLRGLSWPGRLERVGEMWLDVAHNLQGIEALLAALVTLELRPVAAVFGCRADKPGEAMARALSRVAPLWWVDLSEREKGQHPPRTCARRFVGAGDPRLLAALAETRDAGACMLVCGSHILVGALRAWALDVDPADRDDPTLTDPSLRSRPGARPR